MRNIIIVIFISVAVISCKTTKTVVTSSAVHDTLYQNHVRYDSVFVDNSVFVDRKGDTVYVRENHVQYRYRLVHDTIKAKTVTVTKTKTKTKTATCVPAWCKWVMASSLVAVLVLLVIIRWRSKLF